MLLLTKPWINSLSILVFVSIFIIPHYFYFCCEEQVLISYNSSRLTTAMKDNNIERVRRAVHRGVTNLPGASGRYLLQKVPVVQWLPKYSPRWIINDGIAGLTVGVIRMSTPHPPIPPLISSIPLLSVIIFKRTRAHRVGSRANAQEDAVSEFLFSLQEATALIHWKVVPQALAYAKIAGIPLQDGLLASWLPSVLYFLMGTSKGN